MDYAALEEALRPKREAKKTPRGTGHDRYNRRTREIGPAWVRVCEAYAAGKLRVGKVYSSSQLHKLCGVCAGLGTAYLQFDLAIHRAPLVLHSEGFGGYRVEERFAEK